MAGNYLVECLSSYELRVTSQRFIPLVHFKPPKGFADLLLDLYNIDIDIVINNNNYYYNFNYNYNYYYYYYYYNL